MKRWKLLDSKTIFDSKWIKLKNQTYDLGNGNVRGDYYEIERDDYSIVIAETEEKKLVVIKQFRRGADDFFYEFPAGMIDENEDPVLAGERELKEETGYYGKGKFLGELYAQPVFTKLKANVICVKVEGHSNTINPSSDELIETYLFSVDEIKEMIRTGKITCMGFVSAFNLYLLNKT